MSKNLLMTLFLMTISFSAFAETDPCSTLADLTSKSNPNSFVGFAAGTTQKAADDNAQVDLASRIRQKVTATSTVTENTDSANLESNSKSVVSESLIGAKVLRRCANTGTYSTVVSLDKNLFVSSLEKKLSYHVGKVKQMINSLNTAKDDEAIARNIDNAKKFITDYQATFEGDLELCKIYSGCADIKGKDEHIFSDLVSLVASQGDKDQYLMITNQDEVTENFRDELIGLVEKDGVKVMDGVVNEDNSPIHRKIYAKCKAKPGSKIPGTSSDKVIETNCVLEAYIGKQKSFRKSYACKAMVDADSSMEEAVSSCSGRLQ
jgi:hypothetical protein